MLPQQLKNKITLAFIFCLCHSVHFKVWAQLPVDTNNIKANIQLGIDSVIVNPAFTKNLAAKMLLASKQANYPWGIFMNTMITGAVACNEGQFKAAVKLHEEALVYCRANRFRHKESVVLANIAKDYVGLGDHKKAIDLLQQALEVAQAIKDTIQIAQALQGIGHSFNQMDYSKETIQYCSQAASLFILKGKPQSARIAYNNICAAYIDLSKFDSAYRYAWLADDQYQLATAGAFPPIDFYTNLAIIYDSLGKKDSATYCQVQAVKIGRETGNEKSLQSVLYQLGTRYGNQGENTLAIKYLAEAFQYAEKFNNLDGTIDIAKALADVYFNSGDYKNAYTYRIKAAAANDSLLTREKVQALAALNAKFETQQLQLSNIELQKKLESQRYAMLRNWFLLYGGLSIAAILVLAALFYARKKKLQYRIQNMELEQKQFRAQMNPHFIFNCMNSIQHYIVSNDVKAANKFLAGFASLMRRTLDINAKHFISIQDEMEYLENYLRLEQMRFDGKFNYTLNCDETIDRTTSTLPTMMIQPFAENAIQHGLRFLPGNNGVVSISFQKVNQLLICTIDDNGVGRQAASEFKAQSATPHISHAVALIENKLSVLNSIYKTSATLSIADNHNSSGNATGTTVVLKFPLKWK